MIADIGTHEGSYKGEPNVRHQIIIGWELPECLQVFDAEKGEEPAMISAFYTLSLGEKANLRKMLQQWRGRAFTEQELSGFDISTVLGVACLLQVIHTTKADGNVRAKIDGVMKLPKGMACPDQYNKSRLFDLSESTEEQFRALPEWVREKVKQSAEFSEFVRRVNGAASSQEAPEDITFQSDAPVEQVVEDEVPF